MTQAQIETALDVAALIAKVHGAFDENAEYRELRRGLERLTAIKAELQPGQRGYEQISLIMSIVGCTLCAKSAREAGRIAQARRLESEADQKYNTLPRDWKW